jgi:hypothetical protein
MTNTRTRTSRSTIQKAGESIGTDCWGFQNQPAVVSWQILLFEMQLVSISLQCRETRTATEEPALNLNVKMNSGLVHGTVGIQCIYRCGHPSKG